MILPISAFLGREGLDLGGVRAPLYSLASGDMPQAERCAAMEKWVS
ncbi:MAG: hypothetical protein LUE91_05705 [Oscillospiraceae bacterium]|nr:hypothetical protein [Oscillospiraceae bacterium]